MKKIIITTLVIVFILYGIYSLFLKRTPERLLKQQFDISLTNFDYTIESFDEQWNPNGDGYVLIIINFNQLSIENIDYLKEFELQPLPISENDRLQMIPNDIPNQYFDTDTGYYLYKLKSTTDIRDFKTFIIDTNKKRAILYYQLM